MPQKTDEPGYTPDADIHEPEARDRRREGTLGGLLIFIVPMLILLGAGLMWWGNLGFTGPAAEDAGLADPDADEITAPLVDDDPAD